MWRDAVELLGWALLHFVWQGLVVGLIAAAVLATMRRRSANARYLTGVVALSVMSVLPQVTLGWLYEPPSPFGESPIVMWKSYVEVPDPTSETGTTTAERFGIDFENPPPPDAIPIRLEPAPESDQVSLPFGLDRWSWQPALPWIVSIWLAGVVVLSVRLLFSWLHAQRLRRRSSQPADERWQTLLRHLAKRMRVTRPVQLVESALVEVPAVIGWLIPIILLPASAMTGLTTEQLEALLAHELAHVRRHDYLVNLLQTVVETLLFYHPAVWWVSHRIRIERERCCDDLAVRACGDGLTYAKALVALEELRAPVSRFALGAADGSLCDRVQRVIALPSNQRSTASSQFAVVSGCLAIVLVAVFLTQSPRGQGTSPPKPEPVNSDRVIISGGVTTAENKPVADAEVFLPFDLSNGLPDQEHCEVTRTDETGHYRFEVSSREYFDHAKRDYSFLVWALRPGTGMGISVIERPKVGSKECVSNIELRPGRPFVVRVLDPDGQPVADAMIQPSGMTTPTDQYPVPTLFSKRMRVQTNSEGLAEISGISEMNWFVLQVDTKLFGTQALYYFDPRPKPLNELVYKLKRTARIQGSISSAPRPKNHANASGYLVTRWNAMQKELPRGERRLMVGAPNLRINRLLNSEGNFDLIVPEGMYHFEFDHDFDVQHGTTTTLHVDGDKVEIQKQPTPETNAERKENPAPNVIEKSDPEKRVVARVNGVAIHEADVTSRYFSQLALEQARVTPEEFRKMVDELIRRDLPTVIQTKLLVAEAMKFFDAKQRQEAEEFIKRNLAEQLVAMMKDSGVTNREELQNWLRQRGTSLERLESEYKERLYAQQFLAKKLESAKTPEETEKLRSQLLLQLWQQAEVKSGYLPHRGEIKWVDRPNERVWINLGEADGVKRGAVFRVVSIPPNNDPAQPIVIKGKIAVIRLIDAHTSEARILESDNDGPAKGNEVIPADFPDPKATGVDLRLLFPFRKPEEDKGRFVGRVRLKTEKALPDLESVKLPPGKILDESLVFSKDGGLANVFVYLRKPTFKIAPPTESEVAKPFVLIAESGKFWPRAALVRVGRPVVLENSAVEPMNFHTHPVRNNPLNVLVRPQDRFKSAAFEKSENIPLSVKNDIKPWMLAHLLPLDHPFAAVTDEDGRFRIDGLPTGEHEFRVWHERVGWLEKSHVITIKPGEDARSELEYAPDRLKLTENEVLGWGNRLIDAKWIPRAMVPRQAVPQPEEKKQDNGGAPRPAQLDRNDVEIRLPKESAAAAKAEWVRMLEVNRKVPGTVSDSEIQRAKAAYEKGLRQLELSDQEKAAAQAEIEALEKAANEVRVRFADKVEKVAKAEYEKMLESNRRVPESIPDTEVQRAKLSWELAQLKLKQAEVDLARRDDPELRVRLAKKAAEVAKAEYEKILDANRRVPGSIPDTEVERARLNYEKARLIEMQAEHLKAIRDLEAKRLAVERGIAFLKAQQQDGGTWQGTPADGVTALCAAALLQAGVKADDPIVQKALVHLRKVEPTLSYTVALQTMVFCSASPKDDAELIRRNVAWLEKAQASEGPNRGAWSYMANNTKFGDGSCSRFAMLGLHAAKKAGFEVKAETWRNASDYWMTHQKKDSHAWSYQPGSTATPSMTLSGMACLAIVNQHLPQDEQTKLRTEAIERAVPFVEPNAHLLWHSGHGGYALQCLERAARLNRWQKFGKHELRKLIDEKLLGLQKPEGHWTGVGGSGGGFFAAPAEQTPEQKAAAEAARRRQVQSDDLIATSFALMCLTGQPEPPRERQLRFEPREMGKLMQIRSNPIENSSPPMQRTEISGGVRIEAVEPDGSKWRIEADRAVIESRARVNEEIEFASSSDVTRIVCSGSVKIEAGQGDQLTQATGEKFELDLRRNGGVLYPPRILP